MPSLALSSWITVRGLRIDQLLTAHRSIGGDGPGRRWKTEQLNWSLVMRIAGEFQGYCRDLHDQSVDHFVASVSGGNIPLRNLLRINLTAGRYLDKGNAGPSQISEDFKRFGMDLWPAVYLAAGSKSRRWNPSLAKLIEARNGIAHADDGKLARLKNEGYAINLVQVRKWVGHLNGLVNTMDDIVADYLDQFLGCGRPW
ncbi:hypothetical protein [Saccharothrix australiensis]|uniref:hypothetical protein n=1 Tax=Saccharothrix australiensis TaxID=2072 RepID=UPI0011C35A06|nr:hypothetical protein [Saccharothrix australiensis]